MEIFFYLSNPHTHEGKSQYPNVSFGEWLSLSNILRFEKYEALDQRIGSFFFFRGGKETL